MHDVDAVLVAGATGGTGREVLRRAGPRVETVRALTRSPGATADLRAAGADEVAVDDLLDPDDLAAAVDGVDAVISAVGTAPSAVRDGPPFVDGAGNRALLDAAVEAGVDAFVMESAIGVGPEPASPLASASTRSSVRSRRPRGRRRPRSATRRSATRSSARGS